MSEVIKNTSEDESLSKTDQSKSLEEETEGLTQTSRQTDQALNRLRAPSELARCNQLYHQGSFEEALIGYQEMIEQLEDDKVLANVGYTLQALGRHKEAIEAFDQYLKTYIARHHAWKALCFSHYHLKDYENMTRCAREAIRWDIRLNTPDDYSWQQMATAHFLMEDYSTALKAARKASALNDRNPYSKYYEACAISAYVAGVVLDEEGLFDQPPSYEDALERLKEALDLRPDLSEELKSEGYLDEVFLMLESTHRPQGTDEDE